MKKVLSLVLAVVMTMLLLVGCGDKNGGEVPATATRDSVNLSVTQALTTADPHATTYVSDRIILWQVYQGLMHYNEETGTAEYDLATNYEISEDGMTYTFKLRDDVYFHNGDKMTADDVVFSYTRVLNPAMAMSMYSANIVGAEAIDETTVAIHLACPYAPFINNACMIFIVSEREVNELGNSFGTVVSTAGTGPYKFIGLDSDTKIELEAFDKYFNGAAAIKYVNFYPVSDTAAGLISFESGDFDYYNCGVMDAMRIESEGNFNVEILAANHIAFLAINPNSSVEALHDQNVRQAIAYAINKDELNEACFEGQGMVADYLENPDWNIGAPKGDVVYSYNPEKAKELLAASGYTDGVDIGKILCFKGNHFETAATLIQSQLKAVGINAELEWNEQATTLARGKAFEYDLFCTGGNCSGDYDNLRKRFYSSMSTKYVDFSTTEYGTEYLDTMIDKSASCSDPDERLAINKELNDYFMTTATYLPLYHKAVPYVWSKNLNVVNHPINPIIYEWSWN